jgi:hypothetical protein
VHNANIINKVLKKDKKMNSKISQFDALKTFFVTSTDDRIDLEASVEKYRSLAMKYIVAQESQDALILECVADVFSEHKGATLNIDYIKSQTWTRMAKIIPNAKNPEVFAVVSARIEEVFNANVNRPAVEATEKKPAKLAVEGKLYEVKRGKGGGYFCVADQAVKV